MNGFDPVQRDLGNHLRKEEAADAVEAAIESIKEDLWDALEPSQVADALSEVDEASILWKELCKALKQRNKRRYTAAEASAARFMDYVEAAVDSDLQQLAERTLQEQEDAAQTTPPDEDEGETFL